MIRVAEIEKKEPYILTCKFNNGLTKKLDILPLIKNHKNLEGIDKLLDTAIFDSVQIGEFGEIVWKNIIKSTYNGEETIWDYDISPEFAFENAI